MKLPLLSIQSTSSSDQAAILAPDRPPLTFSALQSFLATGAISLRKAGIRRADRVALVLPNGPEAASAFLAVSSAAACAPLNPSYGAAEFEFYLSDLGARALIVPDGSQSPAVEVAEKLGIAILRLQYRRDQAAGLFELSGSAGDPVCDNGESQTSDVALLLHTSGTTSRPKLVPLTHGNLEASARNIARTLALTPADRCLNVMPLFHIHGLVAAVLSSRSAGASVVCTPGFLAPRFFDWLEEFQPTWYTAVPTMHQSILSRAREVHRRPALRFVRSSSAPLPPVVMRELEEVFAAPVIEAYGMTEAAHQMASNCLPPGVRKPGSVGIAAGPEIAVLDDAGRLLGAGDAGEVAIRGENVTAGYEANPEATAAAFDNGWFRTGDLGRLDEDGYLFLTGRKKEIINRGGEKISPREVDEVLLEHPAIAEALCFGIPHRQLGEAVGAAVVRWPGVEVTEFELQQFVSCRLAQFKVPQLIRLLDAIPKGPTGKPQRIGMAERLGLEPIDEQTTQSVGRPPQSDIESRVARLWSRLVRREVAGVQQSFFAAGGDSLLAAQMLEQLRNETGVSVPMVRFLAAPNILGLAVEVERAAVTPDSGLICIESGEASRVPLFCAAGHNGLWKPLARLAGMLGGSQPVYGFLQPRIDRSHPFVLIEDYAVQCVGRMRQMQPRGPYQVAGLCHGGFVAFEIARQLEAAGEQVSLLALFDSYYDGGRHGRLSSAQRARHARWRAANVASNLGAGTGKRAFIKERLMQFAENWAEKAARPAYRFFLATGLRPPGALARLRFANPEARRRYRPEPINGSMLLFRVEDLRPESDCLGWRDLVRGGIKVFDCPFHNMGASAETSLQVIAHELRPRLEAKILQSRGENSVAESSLVLAADQDVDD